jgi:hypothetical protein
MIKHSAHQFTSRVGRMPAEAIPRGHRDMGISGRARRRGGPAAGVVRSAGAVSPEALAVSGSLQESGVNLVSKRPMQVGRLRKGIIMSNVIVVIGPGSIGQAIARRVSAGKHVLLAGLRQENADAAAEVLSNAGFEVSTATVDVSSRESVHALVHTATALGDVIGVIHAAGVSPSQASPETILSVDLYGTALVLRSSAMSSPRVVPVS